jgi:hypothetical protein
VLESRTIAVIEIYLGRYDSVQLYAEITEDSGRIKGTGIPLVHVAQSMRRKGLLEYLRPAELAANLFHRRRRLVLSLAALHVFPDLFFGRLFDIPHDRYLRCS